MRPSTVIIHVLALALAGSLVVAAQAREHWDGISLLASGAAYAICATIVARWIGRRVDAAQAARASALVTETAAEPQAKPTAVTEAAA